jgi:hypothetical protein
VLEKEIHRFREKGQKFYINGKLITDPYFRFMKSEGEMK